MTLNRNALLNALIGDQENPSTADVNAILGTMPRREGAFLTEYHDNSIGPAPWISDLGNSISRLSTNSLADVLMAPQGTPQAEQGMKNAIMDTANVAMAVGGPMALAPKPAGSLGIFGGRLKTEFFDSPRFRSERQTQLYGDELNLAKQGGRDFGDAVTHYGIEPHGADAPAGFVTVRHGSDRPYIDAVEVLPEFKGKGLASKAYDMIEGDIGQPIAPSNTLSDSGRRLWEKRNPAALENYRQVEPGWWSSPEELLRRREKAVGVNDALVQKIDQALRELGSN